MIIALSVIVAGLLIAAAIVFINQEKIKDLAENEMSAEAVAEKVINFINKSFSDSRITAFLAGVSDEGSFYKIHIGLEFQEMEGAADEFDVFASKDGKFFFPEAYDLNEEFVLQEEEELSELPDIEAEDLAEFVECLSGVNFVIYGANWCGYTASLVNMLGGWEAVEPIYVECVEQEELCQEKQIAGYPTILINGEYYQKARTFKDFSEATGCPVPAGSENQNTASYSGGC